MADGEQSSQFTCRWHNTVVPIYVAALARGHSSYKATISEGGLTRRRVPYKAIAAAQSCSFPCPKLLSSIVGIPVHVILK